MSPKFKKGDRVLLNSYGQTKFPERPFTGTVAKVIMKSDGPPHLRIKMDERGYAQTWTSSLFINLSSFSK